MRGVESAEMNGKAKNDAGTTRPGSRRARRIAEESGGHGDVSRVWERLSNYGVGRDKGCYSHLYYTIWVSFVK